MPGDGRIRVDVVQGRARRHEARRVVLPEGATVADAIAAAGLPPDGTVACAVFGERVAPTHALADGDRVELLRPLMADPKDARRRRATK